MTWLVAGLGNPGTRYERTRHNIGRMVAVQSADRIGSRFKNQRKYSAEVSQADISGHHVLIACSRGYMNESGGPVTSLMRYFKVPTERLIVIHDELDLDLGRLRVKSGGGDNGHNGLKSVRTALGTGEFFRVRCGIGRPRAGQDVYDYVLEPFAKSQREDVAAMIEAGAEAVESLIEHGLKSAQNVFNR